MIFAFSAANLVVLLGLGLFLFVPIFVLFWIILFSIINFVYIGLSVYSPKSLFRDVLLFKLNMKKQLNKPLPKFIRPPLPQKLKFQQWTTSITYCQCPKDCRVGGRHPHRHNYWTFQIGWTKWLSQNSGWMCLGNGRVWGLVLLQLYLTIKKGTRTFNFQSTEPISKFLRQILYEGPWSEKRKSINK